MKKYILLLIFFCAGVLELLFAQAPVPFNPGDSDTLKGRKIMEAADNSGTSPVAMVSNTTMMIVKGNPDNPIIKRSVTRRVKRSENETWTLSETVYPSRMKILTYSYSNRDDEIWIKLSSGAPKRISGSGKQGYVQNSHLTYEDMESMDLDDYRFSYLTTGTIAVEGTPTECYWVERTKVSGESSRYSKSRLYITKDELFIVRIDMWDQNGNPHKTWRVLDLEQVQGTERYTLAAKIGVSLVDDPTTPRVDEGKNQYTIMELADIRVDDDADINLSDFKKESM